MNNERADAAIESDGPHQSWESKHRVMTANIEHWLKAEPVQNFGDFLSQFLVQELFYPVGMPARSIHIIGSVISDLFVPCRSQGEAPNKPIAFWGCGLRDPGSLAEERRRDTAIFSVRGPLSASELRLGATVPIGDPSLLLPALHRLRPAPSFAGRTVCIPHFHDKRSDDRLREMTGCDLVLRPNIGNDTEEILRFVDAIGSADFTLSASLHGALVAAAYGRPFAFWDNGDIDLPFKWQDTAALLQIPALFCQDIESARVHYDTQIKPAIRVPSLWTSLAVAPLLLRPTGLLKALRHELADRVTPDVLAELDAYIAAFQARSGHSEQLLAAIERETRELQSGATQQTEAVRLGMLQAREELEAARQRAQQASEEAAASAIAVLAANRDRDGARQELEAVRQELQARQQELQARQQELEAGRQELEAGRQELETARQRTQQANEEATTSATAAQVANNERDVVRQELELARRGCEVAQRQLRDLNGQQKLLRLRLQRAKEQAETDQRRIAEAARTAETIEQVRKRTRRVAKAREKAETRLLALHAESKALRKRLVTAETLVATIRSSTSWKITSPMRKAASALPRLKTAVGWTPENAKRALTPAVAQAPAAADVPNASARTSPVEPREQQEIPRRADVARRPPLKGELDWLAPVVLMIDSVYPRPDQDSGSVDAVNFIEIFQTMGYQVAFIGTAEFAVEKSPARDALTTMGVYCVSQADYESVEAFLSAASAALDVCFLSRVDSGGCYIEAVKRLCPDAKIIFNTVDLHHVREMRQAVIEKDRRASNIAGRTREREIAVARLADATIVVSEQEAQLLSETIPGTPVYTIPLIRKSPGRRNGFAPRHGVGFVGGFKHTPNVDAIHHFLDTIWPDVRKRLPDVPFYIMGANMPDEIRDRSDPGVIALGHVPDLAARLEELRVTVAPLRYGAGLKGKVASSLGHGVPCVVTSIAAEGFGAAAQGAIAVADTPEAFCQQVVELHTNEERWTELSDAGLALMASRHSFANGRRILGELLTAVNASASDGIGRDLVRPDGRTPRTL